MVLCGLWGPDPPAADGGPGGPPDAASNLHAGGGTMDRTVGAAGDGIHLRDLSAGREPLRSGCGASDELRISGGLPGGGVAFDRQHVRLRPGIPVLLSQRRTTTSSAVLRHPGGDGVARHFRCSRLGFDPIPLGGDCVRRIPGVERPAHGLCERNREWTRRAIS